MNPILIMAIMAMTTVPAYVAVVENNVHENETVQTPLTLFVGTPILNGDNVSVKAYGRSPLPLTVSLVAEGVTQTLYSDPGNYTDLFNVSITRLPGCVAKTFQIVAVTALDNLTEKRNLLVCGDVVHVRNDYLRVPGHVAPDRVHVIVERVYVDVDDCCETGEHATSPSPDFQVVSYPGPSEDYTLRASLLGNDVMMIPVKLPSVKVDVGVVGQNVQVST